MDRTHTHSEEIILNGSALNNIDERITEYKKEAVKKISFTIIVKPVLFSVAAVFLSFFLDLSNVPLLGNISAKMAKALFPSWNGVDNSVVPYSFWWIPVVVFIVFLAIAYTAFNRLQHEVINSNSPERIDKVLSAYTSVVDSISMTMPLLGAAVLLISIKLGEEIFIGFSVPFEVKALIVLATGKLIEPVFDQLGISFQDILDRVKEMKTDYQSELQLRNFEKLAVQLSAKSPVKELDSAQFEKYHKVLSETVKLSEALEKNFSSIHSMLEKINKLPAVSAENAANLNKAADAINLAVSGLKDEKTITGLKYLESIVKK